MKTGPREIDEQIKAIAKAIVADTDTGPRGSMAGRYVDALVDALAWELACAAPDQHRSFMRDGLTGVRRRIDEMQQRYAVQSARHAHARSPLWQSDPTGAQRIDVES